MLALVSFRLMGVGVSPAIERAYSLIEIKGIDEEQRIIRGMATTPTPDRGDDVVEPSGVKFRNPLPFILHHDRKSPVGEVFFDAPTRQGVAFTARIPKVKEPGIVRDRVDEAWHSAKYGLLKGVSIGYIPLTAERRKTGGVHLKEIEVVELSMVAVPMNAETTIALVKSLDAASRAVSGTRASVSSSSGVPDKPSKGRTMHFPVSERIKSLEEERQQQADRLKELIDKDDAELTDEETKERDGLTVSIESKASKLKSLKALESAQVTQAEPVKYSPAVKREERIQVTNHAKELPKGTLFTRYAMAVAAGKGSYSDTLEYAKQFTNTPVVAEMVKHFRTKAVEGTSVVQSPGWGGELVNPNTALTEFVELLMPETIIGKITTFDRVPFNIPIITQTGGSTFQWVDEGAPKPVGELDFTRDTMGHSKCAGIIVMTEELVRLSTPSAEQRARRDLINQCRKFLDEQFIQVAITAGTESPASITNGVASPAASGTDVDALKADLVTAFGTFTANSIPLSGLVIVMTPDLALGISLLTNALGQTPVGFNVTPTGGTLLGYQVVVSESVDSGTMVIFKPSEIFLADDGEVRLDASNQATLAMDGGATATFNLWQRNCVGLRAERWINWKKRRPNVVAVIDTASYGPSVGS